MLDYATIEQIKRIAEILNENGIAVEMRTVCTTCGKLMNHYSGIVSEEYILTGEHPGECYKCYDKRVRRKSK